MSDDVIGCVLSWRSAWFDSLGYLNGLTLGITIVQWYRRAPNGYPVNDAKHWFNHNVRVYSPLQTTLPTAERYNLTSHGYAQCYNVLQHLTTYYNTALVCVYVYMRLGYTTVSNAFHHHLKLPDVLLSSADPHPSDGRSAGAVVLF